MARIALSASNFKRLPEGKHKLYIYDLKYDETFGQMDIYMYSETTGDTHRERYFLLGKDGSANENAIAAFSYTARVALNDFELEDIDPEELVGHRFYATAEHQLSNGKTYVRLNDKKADDQVPGDLPWETSTFRTEWLAKKAPANEQKAEAPAAPAAPATTPATGDASVEDLLAMLG